MKCHDFLSSKCQSCDLLDKTYEESLIIKEKKLNDLFPLHSHVIKPTIGLNNQVPKSRHKAKLAVFLHENELTFGIYKSDGTAIPLENCPLHSQGMNEILKDLKPILKKFKIIPYDLITKKGELKYLLISKNKELENEQFLLRFVLRSKESLDRLKKAVDEIKNISEKIKVITANIQPKHQAILAGEEEIVLTSEEVIVHQFDEFKLLQTADSFFQVTPVIAHRLYNAFFEAIANDRPSSLVDLYCGVGAFSFYASRVVALVTGVEISKKAIVCAKQSLILNNNDRIDFISSDVELFLKNKVEKYKAIVVNPPRRGLNHSIIEMIQKMSPQYIYYSSCNAETLVRDFFELEKNYQIKSLQVFDMFPYTSHFETLMCLSKK